MTTSLNRLLLAPILALSLVALGCSSDDAALEAGAETAGQDEASSSPESTPGSERSGEVADESQTATTSEDASAQTSAADIGSGSAGARDDAAGPTDEPRPAADVHRQLLVGLADKVILPTYRDFHSKADALEAAATAYKASLSSDDLDTLKGAWHDAMDAWQYAEVLQLGPAGSMTTALGGEDRRSEIYSWPTINACRVDQELTEEAYADSTTLNAELVNTRGLDALEYLLFGSVDENSCKATSKINKDGIWQSVLDSGELPARRAAYAHSASVLVAEEAKNLLDAWEAEGGDFRAEFSNAGTSSSVYASAQAALNAVSDAMFYVEKQTKDMKVAQPAGISGCEEATCPESLESRYASRSKENAIANLKALQWLFHGGPDATADLGFDDILSDMGASALADDFTVALTSSIETLSTMEGSFADALVNDPEKMATAYAAVKSVSDLLKTEFVSTLDLEIPNRAAGDND